MFYLVIRTILIISFVSCSFFSTSSPTSLLRLKDRTLLINPDAAELIYPYFEKVCTRRLRIFNHCDQVRKVIVYDLTNKDVRKELIDNGFVVRTSERFEYK